MKKLSQKAEIRRYLEAGGKLTQMAALNFWGCSRLASRIFDIDQDLYYEWLDKPPGIKIKQIETEMVKTNSGKFIAQYSLKTFD